MKKEKFRLLNKSKKIPFKPVVQRDKYSCGVIALINALKAVGLSFSYKKHFKLLKYLTGCVPPKMAKEVLKEDRSWAGTQHYGLISALRNLHKYVDYRIFPNIKKTTYVKSMLDLYLSLNKPYTFIVTVGNKKAKDYHFCTIIDYKKNKYLVTNYWSGISTVWIKKETLCKRIINAMEFYDTRDKDQLISSNEPIIISIEKRNNGG